MSRNYQFYKPEDYFTVKGGTSISKALMLKEEGY